jgi:hypothetical protein
MSGPAFDRKAHGSTLIATIVGKSGIGFSEGLYHDLRIEQAPQIVTR